MGCIPLICLFSWTTDRRDSLRKFGYSLRCMPAISHKLLVRGKRVAAIGVMSAYGVLDCHIVDGNVAGERFEEFVEKSLLRHLMPFNGTNPHSIVIMDNAAIHHVPGIVDLVQSTGALLIFLPPYSPDLMPIELCFSKIKAYLKANEIALQVLDDPIDAVLAAFISVTAEDCVGWVNSCGY